MGNRLWVCIHHCLVHPLLGLAFLLLGYIPEWAYAFHDWTARFMWLDDDA